MAVDAHRLEMRRVFSVQIHFFSRLQIYAEFIFV